MGVPFTLYTYSVRCLICDLQHEGFLLPYKIGFLRTGLICHIFIGIDIEIHSIVRKVVEIFALENLARGFANKEGVIVQLGRGIQRMGPDQEGMRVLPLILWSDFIADIE